MIPTGNALNPVGPTTLAEWIGWLRRELAPQPGRRDMTIRLVTGVALITVISLALQVPEAALSAYLVFFITKENRTITLLGGVLAIVGATIAIALGILVYRATFDNPPLRVAVIAVSVFLGMYLSRIFVIGPLAFVIGFIVAASQSLTDLTSDPDLLVRALLWVWVAVVYPIVVTILVNLWLLPAPETPRPKHAASGLFVADAFTNRAHVFYALKVTLAAMTCYIVYTAADWSGIHTAFITCCFVSLESTGATVQKGWLRLSGCVIGGALGFLSILYLIPRMESIVSLVLLVSAVSALAGWIAAGSERIAYCGLQIAFAFYLCVFQGFGPSTDLDTIRDRLVGIIFGLLVLSFVFRHVWPETALQHFRQAVAGCLRTIARKVSPGPVAETSMQDLLHATERQAELAGFETSDAAHRRALEEICTDLRRTLDTATRLPKSERSDLADRISQVAESFAGSRFDSETLEPAAAQLAALREEIESLPLRPTPG